MIFVILSLLSDDRMIMMITIMMMMIMIVIVVILSLPSERDNRLSAVNPEMRSKTDNLERLISEVERTPGAASDQGGSTSSLGKREVRQYIRSVLPQ